MEFVESEKKESEAPPATPARGGFSFELALRNAMLARAGYKMPKAQKTGTTIAGVVFDGGVVLGADTRATAGTIVADKNCEKIHYIAPNIYCCGAGTSADTENTTAMISSQLELLRLSTRRQSRVITACTRLKRYLFRYRGYVSAALVLGGVDATGPHLYTVYPHGSTDKLPFVTMGSGSLAAMAVFEAGYREALDEASAMDLVASAIRAGVYNDLGSGGNVDLCVITADGTRVLRSYESENDVAPVHASYDRPAARIMRPGTTRVLAEKVRELRSRLVIVEDGDEESKEEEDAELLLLDLE